MTQQIFIGIDIGTTGVRAVAYELSGKKICYADEYYPLETPYPHYAEQNQEMIYIKTKQVLKEVLHTLMRLGKKPLGIALSTTMHSFALTNKQNQFISNFIIWADSRSAAIVKEFKATNDYAKTFYEKTCCPPHSCYPYFKMLWFRQTYKDLEIARVYSLKDYIFENLTGQWCIDKACACASGFYNANLLEWDKDLLESTHLHKEQLPKVVDTTFSSPLKLELQKELGLQEALPIVIGASDGVLVNLGIGAFTKGDISATIGTSGAVRMISHGVKRDSKGRTWCYNLLDDTWVVGGAINNGGIIMRWMRDNICHYSKNHLENIDIDAYDLMTLKASKVPAGSDGLLVLPFFTGERAPYWNSDLRGMFFGLSLKHSRSHIIRAIMEGICFGLKSIYDVLINFEEVKQIKVSGSFTKSNLWVQILSDILESQIIVPENSEGAAFGATILGFLALGIIKDLQDLENLQNQVIYYPQIQHFTTYESLYKLYENLYNKLQDDFALINALQKED